MVYTNKPFPNSEFEFPPPPAWLTWIGTEGKGGKIRHQDSLAQCKKYMSGWSSYGDEWYYDWAIYEWTGTKYELRYEGKKGQKKRAHPLWKETVKKSDITGRDATDEELEAAMQSILGVLNG